MVSATEARPEILFSKAKAERCVAYHGQVCAYGISFGGFCHNDNKDRRCVKIIEEEKCSTESSSSK
jgi:hypothetical protein